VFQDSLSNLSLLFFVAIGVVYIVLGMLYESYITRSRFFPAALRGASAVWSRCGLFGNELNIYSFVGLILLIGLVMKNAIMQIDFALDAERRSDKTPTEAIYEGCIVRFRPDHDDAHGDAAWRAARLRSVSDPAGKRAGRSAWPWLAALSVSQVITLYLTPVVYTFMATWVKTRKIPAVVGLDGAMSGVPDLHAGGAPRS